jgi:hypothetical protein
MSQFEQKTSETIWEEFIREPSEEERVEIEKVLLRCEIFGGVSDEHAPEENISKHVRALVIERAREIVSSAARKGAERAFAKYQVREGTFPQTQFAQQLVDVAVDLDLASPTVDFLKCIASSDRAGARKVLRRLA